MAKRSEEIVEAYMIRVKGLAMLVQYNSEQGITRRVIPEDAVVSRNGNSVMVAKSVLEQGLEYGIQWEERLPKKIEISGEALAKSLRESGIWTYADMVENPKNVMSAIQSVLGLTFEFIVHAAKEAAK